MNGGVKICGYVFGNTDTYYRRISYVTFLFNNYHCTRSIAKSKLLNGTETSFSRALISDNSVSLVRLKRELWVGAKQHRSGLGRGGGCNYVYTHLKTYP